MNFYEMASKDKKLKEIDHGFFQLSAIYASRIGKGLPRVGYEKSAVYQGIPVWIARTRVFGKEVWSIRAQA